MHRPRRSARSSGTRLPASCHRRVDPRRTRRHRHRALDRLRGGPCARAARRERRRNAGQRHGSRSACGAGAARRPRTPLRCRIRRRRRPRPPNHRTARSPSARGSSGASKPRPRCCGERSSRATRSLAQLADFAADRSRLYRELAASRGETARYRQLVVDLENDAPPPFFGTVAPDDFKLIVGVGPVLERMLQQLGITTYRQIALWTERDIDEFDAKLPEFPGRIRRDGWVDAGTRASRQQVRRTALGERSVTAETRTGATHPRRRPPRLRPASPRARSSPSRSSRWYGAATGPFSRWASRRWHPCPSAR